MANKRPWSFSEIQLMTTVIAANPHKSITELSHLIGNKLDRTPVAVQLQWRTMKRDARYRGADPRPHGNLCGLCRDYLALEDKCAYCEHKVNRIMFAMHKHLNPGEYGLGEDMLPEKQAWEAMGKLWQELFDVIYHGDIRQRE